MKERPILFSGPMVRAILEGRKTQTRRIIKPQFTQLWGYGVNHGDDRVSCHVNIVEPDGSWKFVYCPYGQPGDRLWVRETWTRLVAHHPPPEFVYKADCTDPDGEDARQDYIRAGYPYQWRPSIHMPRKASRLTLEVASVSVERLQDISEDDARAEGCPANWGGTAWSWFVWLWDSINSKRAPWASNPWVWVVTFKRVLP